MSENQVFDSNGKPLKDGDSVFLTQDLKSKNSKDSFKRGTVFKNIRLGDDPTHVESKGMFLKTEFLKKKE